MFSNNNKISIRQLQALLALDVFGTGVIYLPGVAASFAGQDGWICVAVTAVLATACAYIISSLALAFPGQSFHNYTCAIVPRPLGKLICLMFAFKIILNCAMELRLFGELVKNAMLPFTPLWIVVCVMLLLGAYTAAKGCETRARVAEILLFVAFVPFIVMLAASAFNIDFSNLTPVLQADPNDIMRGGLACGYAFSGAELLLLGLPYVNKKAGVRKNTVCAVAVTGLLMTITAVLTIARFSAKGTERLMWPVLDLLNTAKIPGGFAERLDALILGFWIVSAFAIVNACLFFSSVLLKDTFGRGRRLWYMAAVLPAAAVLACLPDNVFKTLENIRALYNYTGGVFLLFLPLTLLITARIRGLGSRV